MPDDVSDHSEPATVASYATEGEAEVAQAKLSAYGVESALEDRVGGIIPIEGEAGVFIQVRAEDAEDAAEILSEPEPDVPDS